jgi:RND family efflux transporter MFP subunit
MDQPDNNTRQNETDTSPKTGTRHIRWIVKGLLPAVIILAAAGFAKYLIDTQPKAKLQKPAPQARLVTVEIAKQTDHTTFVSAMGTVLPAKTITVVPEVSGKIVSIGPEVIPGGLIHKGQELIRIDSRDYETVVKQRQSELAQAQLNLKLEYGSQSVAQQEYKLLEEILEGQDQELVLRKPHLDSAQAAVQAAAAVLDRAKLDVERCSITAPFNAIIQDKLQDLGSRVSTSTPLLTIIETDEYWIEVLVPVDQLGWITIPRQNSDKGATVKISNTTAWGDSVQRQGTVIGLLGQLEEQGRLAQLLVSVKDPLCLDKDASGMPPILIGSYVRVEIEGKKIASVIPLKRDYLRDGDYVWIMNDRDQMEIRPVDVMFRDKGTVYVSGGLQDGQRIVTTDISAPVDGMPLRLNGTSDSTDAASNRAGGETR